MSATKGSFVVAGALIAALASSSTAAPGPDAAVPQIIDNETRIDVNQCEMVVTNHGSFAYDIEAGNSGLIYPRGTDNTVVFASGLWVGAKVGDEENARVTVGEYSQEYNPGVINADGTWTDPGSAENRTYKIDWNDPDHVTSQDYLEWPFELGAPVDTSDADYDPNNMATWKPQRLGDQTLWAVYNDADPTVHTNDAGASQPLGIEVQQTTFAFDRTEGLGNTIFVKFKMINKSENVLKDAYASVWSDPDLGGAGDDLVGCDTDLSLGYCYNANNTDQLYGGRPPAVGYDFFQGPIVASPGDTAYVSGLPIPDFRNLPMTSFNKYINGTDPHTPVETYNYMLGLNADGTPVMDEVTGEETLFQVPGDPVLGTGWLDSNPADRRFMLSAGPFEMQPGDEQEIVVGIIVAQGSERLSSITLLKIYDKEAQSAYDVNFDLPQPPPRPVSHVREYDGEIDIYWEPYREEQIEISDRLGERYEFEGYNVWQGSSPAGPWQKIATFDAESQFSSIYSDVVNADVGVIERRLTQSGNDNGLQWNIRLDTDRIVGGPLVNYRDYYYAVTAYSAEVNKVAPYQDADGTGLGVVTKTLENSQQALVAMPKASTATLHQIADHTMGISDGSVRVDYVNQDEISTDRYQVSFKPNPDADSPILYLWDLENLTTGEVLLENQTNLTADYFNPITEGFIVQVVGPELAVREWGWTANEPNGARWVSWVDWGGSTFNGGVGLGFEFFGSNLPIPAFTKAIEIRFIADEGEWTECQTYRRDQGYATLGTGMFPGQAWDVTDADPANHRRLNINLVENEEDADNDGNIDKPADFIWNPDGSALGGREYFFIMDSEYDENNPVIYGDPGSDTDGRNTDVLIAGWPRLRGDRPWMESEGTWYFTMNKILTDGDVYEWQAQPVGAGTGTNLDNDLAKIRAVPNPYLNQSSYELNQFDRILRFINLPNTTCTVRIFDLAGELVRTLRKDDMNESILRWDLDNRAGIPVASGIYIYHVEADGIGTTTGKLAVFVEKERLAEF